MSNHKTPLDSIVLKHKKKTSVKQLLLSDTCQLLPQSANIRLGGLGDLGDLWPLCDCLPNTGQDVLSGFEHPNTAAGGAGGALVGSRGF